MTSVTFRARIKGAVAYICPNCSRIERIPYLNHRHPSVKCMGCLRRYGIGIAAFRSAPFSFITALFATSVTPAFNTADDDRGEATIGQIQGPVEWNCPNCGETQKQRAEDGAVTCACGLHLHVRLRLWQVPQGKKWTLPLDWIL